MKLFQIVFTFVSVAVLSGQCNKTDGYTVNESTGHAYKLVYVAQNWTVAVETCAKEGAKLAVPKSKDEFNILQKIVRGMNYQDIIGAKHKYLVWLGISNLENYKIWKNIDGEKIDDTGFHDWAGDDNGQDPWPGPEEPHCVGIDAKNPGFREFWCDLAQPYICEKKI